MSCVLSYRLPLVVALGATVADHDGWYRRAASIAPEGYGGERCAGSELRAIQGRQPRAHPAAEGPVVQPFTAHPGTIARPAATHLSRLRTVHTAQQRTAPCSPACANRCLLFIPQESTLRLLNVLTRLSVGRSYLLQDQRLIPVRTAPASCQGALCGRVGCVPVL